MTLTLYLFQIYKILISFVYELELELGACRLNINDNTLAQQLPFLVVFAVTHDTDTLLFNPLTPMSDQNRIFPYNINAISGR